MPTELLQADDVISAFRPYFDESLSRPIRRTTLDVIKIAAADKKQTPFAVPGTVFVFLTTKESGKMSVVHEAIAKGGKVAEDLLSTWKDQISRRKQVDVPSAVKTVTAAPVFAEIEYGGATLTNGLFVPEGLDYVILVFPYNGGELATGGFVLAEHYLEGSSSSIQGIVVQNLPVLTAAEASALQLVPIDQRGLNVGVAMSCCTTGAAVASAIADIVLLLIALLEPAFNGVANVSISDAEIKKLGPNASARKLLQLRREYLTESVKRA